MHTHAQCVSSVIRSFRSIRVSSLFTYMLLYIRLVLFSHIHSLCPLHLRTLITLICDIAFSPSILSFYNLNLDLFCFFSFSLFLCLLCTYSHAHTVCVICGIIATPRVTSLRLFKFIIPTLSSSPFSPTLQGCIDIRAQDITVQCHNQHCPSVRLDAFCMGGRHMQSSREPRTVPLSTTSTSPMSATPCKPPTQHCKACVFCWRLNTSRCSEWTSRAVQSAAYTFQIQRYK